MINIFIASLLAATQVPVVVENPAPAVRTDWVRFTLPTAAIPAGTLRLGVFPAFRGREVGAGVTLVHAQVRMASWERATWALTGTLTLAAAAAEPANNPPPGIRLRVGGSSWEPVPSTRQDGPCVELHLRGRVPSTQLVGELWAYVYPGAPVVPWELLVVASDPRTSAVYQSIPELTLEVDGPIAVVPYWPRWRGGVQRSLNVIQLAGASTWGDSQGLAWAGVVALTSSPEAGAALYGPISAVASAGTWNGAYGPFGVVPAMPLDERGYVQRLVRWVGTTETTGDLWRAAPLGLLPNSGATGGQDDFGAAKLGWAWTGGPLHVLEAYHSVLHEASRPGLWYEADGSLVDPWLHPDHVTWSGYTHWHTSYSGDRLGKGTTTAPRWSGGYVGPDRQHWSNNTLCGAYLLTGSRVLQRIIEKQARQILSGETLDPRLPSTSGIDSPRGIGRTLLSASWIDRCLEPASELRARVQERILARIDERVEPFTRPGAGWQVAPLGTTEDPRRLGGVRCWGWEEPLGCVGLRAAELQFGSAKARVVLDRALASWLRYGVWHNGSWWMVADNVAFLDGAAPDPGVYPTTANPVPVFPPLVERHEGFEEWSTGALVIATRIFDGELRAKAQAVLAQMPPTSVKQAEWMATR